MECRENAEQGPGEEGKNVKSKQKSSTATVENSNLSQEVEDGSQRGVEEE